MPEKWFNELAGKLRAKRITNKELAQYLDVSETWVSLVLNGKKEPKGAPERYMQAADELIAQKSKSA